MVDPLRQLQGPQEEEIFSSRIPQQIQGQFAYSVTTVNSGTTLLDSGYSYAEEASSAAPYSGLSMSCTIIYGLTATRATV